jgi:hypothetical protein
MVRAETWYARPTTPIHLVLHDHSYPSICQCMRHEAWGLIDGCCVPEVTAVAAPSTLWIFVWDLGKCREIDLRARSLHSTKCRGQYHGCSQRWHTLSVDRVFRLRGRGVDWTVVLAAHFVPSKCLQPQERSCAERSLAKPSLTHVLERSVVFEACIAHELVIQPLVQKAVGGCGTFGPCQHSTVSTQWHIYEELYSIHMLQKRKKPLILIRFVRSLTPTLTTKVQLEPIS